MSARCAFPPMGRLSAPDRGTTLFGYELFATFEIFSLSIYLALCYHLVISVGFVVIDFVIFIFFRSGPEHQDTKN